MVALEDSSAQTYRLRWSNDSSAELNLSEAFRDLRENSDFFDMTLSCSVGSGGSRSLRAHKIILSAYSTVFKEMFQEHSNRADPFIYLKGVSFLELSSLLDFMYNGEVNISQTNLSSFLAVAEELQIKGLQTNNSDQNVLKKPLVKRPIPPIGKPNIPTARQRYETLEKYLKKEKYDFVNENTSNSDNYDSQDGYGVKNTDQTTTSNVASKKAKKQKPPKKEKIHVDDLQANEEDDEEDIPVPEGQVGVVEDFIKNIKKIKIIGNQRRTLARCRLCLKEQRRDKIKFHIRGAHSSYLITTTKQEMDTSVADDDFGEALSLATGEEEYDD